MEKVFQLQKSSSERRERDIRALFVIFKAYLVPDERSSVSSAD
jgi:hypothetical protein